MRREISSRVDRGRGLLLIGGWLLMIALGAALVWFGFAGPQERQPVVTEPSEGLPLTPLAGTGVPAVPSLQPTMTPPTPTWTPLPTETATPIPATATPAIPLVRAGENGVNVRSGPGTNYPILGYLQPGAEARVIGYYGDWWQIQYDGGVGWVFGDIVSPFHTENVPQVQPPPSPTPLPPTATPVPTPTPTSAPAVDTRGIVANAFVVENAPGPFSKALDIWFRIDITNASGGTVAYTALGVWVQETGQFQMSWTYSSLTPGQHFTWRDHINQFTLPSGTYHLWMRMCFPDGYCADLKGPVAVTIQ